MRPRAASVDAQGVEDGWVPQAGLRLERDPEGPTRLVVSVPHDRLEAVHARLLGVLGEPIGILYRQRVDRRSPRAEGSPPRDWVAMDLPRARVLAALADARGVVYHDARAEIWARGRFGDQVVLDTDGVIYCYPDDPAFREAVAELGEPRDDLMTIAQRDYVKQWYHREHDGEEDLLVASLGLTETSSR